MLIKRILIFQIFWRSFTKTIRGGKATTTLSIRATFTLKIIFMKKLVDKTDPYTLASPAATDGTWTTAVVLVTLVMETFPVILGGASFVVRTWEAGTLHPSELQQDLVEVYSELSWRPVNWRCGMVGIRLNWLKDCYENNWEPLKNSE